MSGGHDPQLDTNFLIKVGKGEPDFVTYARMHQAAGLTFNLATQAEYLIQGTLADLQLLDTQYGARVIHDVTLQAIDATAQRLQRAFDGALLGRVLDTADARVAATAFLKGETLATGDLQLYKRGRDLGLAVDFVGSGPSAAKAASYGPRPVIIR